ncbi:MAG TPA: pyridoxal-phosphate dependent enzyme [Nocardiopsis listeri]|uniref:threonine ammonia-lyase n=1 Tax=Nocardiopsis listeri TaxID=53440 RepID=UPI001DA9A67D|nr:pyridoxal-phosphate dependent enzyme [Nocardiopsis listeri]HJE61494.1 pyridoxal-phosphate dependent enzyme [Nocardiopsis listeri]
MHATDLDVARIERATRLIAPVFLRSPQFFEEQLCSALGRRVLTKVETLNPLRSFKGRGVDLLAREFSPGTDLVCSSTGNFGQAMGYAATRHGMSAHVFVPTGTNPVKMRRMVAMGARVHEVEGDRFKQEARRFADQDPNRVFVEDGEHPRVAEGAGTIGVELLETEGIDTIVLPVGDGALITGVARWTKEHAPHIRVVGVCATGAASMVDSWKAGRAVSTEVADTFAEGIAINRPIAASVERMRVLVDDMVVVGDADMLDAMRLVLETVGVLPEPAGAAGIAALRVHDLPGATVATVITGANAPTALFPDVLTLGTSTSQSVS